MPGPGSGLQEHEFKSTQKRVAEMKGEPWPDNDGTLCEICGRRPAVYREGSDNPHPWTCARCFGELQELR